MIFKLAAYTFQGPHAFYSDLKDKPGVYVIIDDLPFDRRIIDVGESERLRTRINNHEREDCWHENCQGTLGIGTFYIPKSTVVQRRTIEASIREYYSDIPCGNQ